MSKKKNVKGSGNSNVGKDNEKEKVDPIQKALEKLPDDVKAKLKDLSGKLEKFKKKVLDKFGDYIIGMALMPPAKEDSNTEEPKKAESKKSGLDKIINVFILVDDSDSKKMSKEELKNKLSVIMNNFAKEIDPIIHPEVWLLSELWQSCYDGHYEILKRIAIAAPLYDKGMLSAIRIAEVHKTMLLDKFEKYIVSYVLAGSLVKGRATKDSDIDVWVVIDDTDVKRMSRAELKDKLRAIIISKGIEAGEITGIRNKLNIQVYILTDFWDSLKEANPIIFTLLRDGVPFYDRGLFMPWKQLLKMGRIKPSKEAIDMFMVTGEEMLRRVKFKLRDIGMEDIYYAILTPSQAALMLYGVAPPDPKETAELMREIFVKKEKLLEEKFVDILENNIKVRKDIEHGVKKDLSGSEVDKLLSDAEKYLKRIKRLFTQIEKMREQQNMVRIYDTIVSVVRDCLNAEGISKVEESKLLSSFKDALVDTGKIPSNYYRILEQIFKWKKLYDDKKLSKVDIEKAFKESNELIKFLVEYLQRKKFRELESSKVRVKYKKNGKELIGELVFLEGSVLITPDLKDRDNVLKAELLENGGFNKPVSIKVEEFNKLMDELKPYKHGLREETFKSIRDFFGSDVEILVNY